MSQSSGRRQPPPMGIERVRQKVWKRPPDGERQPIQSQYFEAGPALHSQH